MNYGLVSDALQDIGEYILGASNVPYVPYNESGSWEQWLPKYENQTTKLGHETSGCTVWASQNQVETLHKFLYNDEPNYSERFTYNLVPIKPRVGADPQNTHECIRNNGLINESDLPITDSIEEYLDATEITGSLLAKGQNWLLKHEYKHEWVWDKNKRPSNYIELLKDALQTSPIAVSVTAWRLKEGAYVSDSGGNNHYCLLYKFDAEGYPWIYDSYDHSKKKLAKDHNIRRAKRIYLNKKTRPAMKMHIALLKEIIKAFTMKTTLLDVCKKYLGKDASPENLANSDVACAETVTHLLRQVYPSTPKILGTYTLYEYLNNPKNGYKRVLKPEPECIVISPTGMGAKGTIGHTGILDEDLLIMSNNSFGVWKGKFTRNHTIETWNTRYAIKQKMPVYYFKHI